MQMACLLVTHIKKEDTKATILSSHWTIDSRDQHVLANQLNCKIQDKSSIPGVQSLQTGFKTAASPTLTIQKPHNKPEQTFQPQTSSLAQVSLPTQKASKQPLSLGLSHAGLGSTIDISHDEVYTSEDNSNDPYLNQHADCEVYHSREESGSAKAHTDKTFQLYPGNIKFPYSTVKFLILSRLVFTVNSPIKPDTATNVPNIDLQTDELELPPMILHNVNRPMTRAQAQACQGALNQFKPPCMPEKLPYTDNAAQRCSTEHVPQQLSANPAAQRCSTSPLARKRSTNQSPQQHPTES
ncbi:hypothetical protein DFH28DRAFT_1133203 [Melampsora americana]|nr:hypothetical protein DFH28DRAFT_1133203 [Melampsora americana]